MDLIFILNKLYPDASWILDGEDYSGLTWLDETITKPSEEDCLSAWVEIEQELKIAELRLARQTAYEGLSDPMYFKWQRGEATEQEWLDSVEAIRQQYPYPTPLE